ncbi:hypothetical protein HDU96_010542 [Phlyctochytrium bullatum]|nr:hypothetical protein HDU96_010542 [Phlyctochytrium bullatum]
MLAKPPPKVEELVGRAAGIEVEGLTGMLLTPVVVWPVEEVEGVALVLAIVDEMLDITFDGARELAAGTFSAAGETETKGDPESGGSAVGPESETDGESESEAGEGDEAGDCADAAAGSKAESGFLGGGKGALA